MKTNFEIEKWLDWYKLERNFTNKYDSFNAFFSFLRENREKRRLMQFYLLVYIFHRILQLLVILMRIKIISVAECFSNLKHHWVTWNLLTINFSNAMIYHCFRIILRLKSPLSCIEERTNGYQSQIFCTL